MGGAVVIAKISKGSRFGGLLVYLAGPGKVNEHEDPHLVAGDPAIAAWHVGQELDRGDALAIARELGAARRAFGTQVRTTRTEWDATAGERVPRLDQAGRPVTDDQHVWHCSLSLHPEEGPLSDAAWAQITHEFMARMGFDDPEDPREPAQWVVVRTDGTKVSVGDDYWRAGQACRALEEKFGLRLVEGREPGFERNEQGYTLGDAEEHQRRNRSAQERGEPTREELDRPRFAKGTDEVVKGYSVAIRGADGRIVSRYMGGQNLARDLNLEVLRKGWSDSPEAATAAAAEWRAGARNLRPAAVGREARDPDPQQWRDWHQQMGQLMGSLRDAGDTGDPVLWARAAREASGALGAWSVRTEADGGPLAEASRALARSAYTSERTRPTGGDEEGRGGPKVAPLLLLAAQSGRRKHLDSLLLAQIMRLSQAVHHVHQQAGRTREAQRVQVAVRDGLTQVRAGLPRPLTLEKFDDPQALLRAEQAWTPPRPSRIAAKPAHRGPERQDRDRDDRARGGVER